MCQEPVFMYFGTDFVFHTYAFGHHSMQRKCFLHPVFTASTVSIAPWVSMAWDMRLLTTSYKHVCSWLNWNDHTVAVCHDCVCVPLVWLRAIVVVACHYRGCVPLLFGSWVLPLCLTIDVCLVLNLLLIAKLCRMLMAEDAHLDCVKPGACLPHDREDCDDVCYGVGIHYYHEHILQNWWPIDIAVLAENDIPQHILRCQSTPPLLLENNSTAFQ